MTSNPLTAQTYGGVQMLVELPKKYERKLNEYSFARIRDGVLELKGDFNFEKIMIELAYQLRGRTKCYYCKKKVSANKITIDHMFPSDFGGVTITNNLAPACGTCNSNKSNMNQYEFKIWNSLKTREEKKKYYHDAVNRKKRKKRNPYLVKKGFDMPRKWIQMLKLEYVEKASKVTPEGSDKYLKMLDFAQKTQKLPRPLILSSNLILIDGETAYAVAKTMQFVEVPVIILENVIVLK